jgi:hypothetical protein
MKRTYAQPLTLELLSEKVPLVKTGYEAHQQLQQKPAGFSAMSLEERVEYNNLQNIVAKGKDAQEALIMSALPLIKDLASKEYSRRQAWSSRVSYEELLSEAVAGFIRGLLSYQPAKTKHSATNYLGQWVVTTVRRRLETLEHDFSIPYEVVERNRRIVAVRSRLTAEMKKEPTDEELLIALNDKAQKPGNKWGKTTNADADPVEPVEPIKPESKRSAQFTQEHLEISRELAAKLYTMQSNEPSDSEEEGSYEKYSTPISSQPTRNVADIEDNSIKESKKEFFMEVFLMMKIGSKQRDIILRFFGMAPYTEPQIYREIVQQTGLSSRFVKNVVMSFNQYMPQKGGIFHYKLLQLDYETTVDLELEWLVPILGEWPIRTKTPVPPPAVLTTSK